MRKGVVGWRGSCADSQFLPPTKLNLQPFAIFLPKGGLRENGIDGKHKTTIVY